jgi:alkylation response protein AidB-like acyl-CoA dehydrogenase
MDFTLDETQQAVIRVAAEVLDHARKPGDQAGSGADAQAAEEEKALWKDLARAGLLSLALPTDLGGDGLGVLEVATALTEIGRRAALVPALATLALGVLPVVRWGDSDAARALLDGVGSGDTILTAAIREPSDVTPLAPATTATLDGEAETGPFGTVSGVKVGVPYGAEADWILVPVGIESRGTGIVVVAKSADGVAWQRTHSAAGQPEYTMVLEQAPVSYVLGAGTGGRALVDLYRLGIAGACCLADGALAGALDLTKQYVASRKQFGRPLATFQAVAGQVSDVYIASRTLHLAALSACWRLETGREVGRDLDVAAYWLAAQAPAALRTCHHLHGGIGMDVTYPLPRYSSLVKDLVRFVGGAEYRLDRLGARVSCIGHEE